MRIEILAEAEQDILDGYRFFEAPSMAMGGCFLQSVLGDIESLHRFAGSHEIKWDYHRLLTSRFPFAIYYKIEYNQIRIHAVLNCCSNPTGSREPSR
jgi:hypothetical protein